MSEALKGALIIGQSGGPSSVINSSAYGCIRTALDADCITKVYGAYHGIKGVLNDELLCMDGGRPRRTRSSSLHPVLRARLLPLQDQGPGRGRHRLQAHS